MATKRRDESRSAEDRGTVTPYAVYRAREGDVPVANGIPLRFKVQRVI